MKNSSLLITLIVLCLLAACNKESLRRQPAPDPPPGTSTEFILKTPLLAVGLPQDTCRLKAYVSNSYPNMIVEWQCISGPAPVVIDNPHVLTPNVYPLQAGTYAFLVKVSVTRNNKKYEKSDTLYLTVASTMNPLGEIILRDLVWQGGPFEDQLIVNNIYSLSPNLTLGTPFRLYEQTKSATNWTEIPSFSSASQPSNNETYTAFGLNFYDGNYSLTVLSSKDRAGETVNLRIAYY